MCLFFLAFAFGEICFLSSLIPVVDRQCLALVRQCRKKKKSTSTAMQEKKKKLDATEKTLMKRRSTVELESKRSEHGGRAVEIGWKAIEPMVNRLSLISRSC